MAKLFYGLSSSCRNGEILECAVKLLTKENKKFSYLICKVDLVGWLVLAWLVEVDRSTSASQLGVNSRSRSCSRSLVSVHHH